MCGFWWYLLSSEQQLFGSPAFLETKGDFIVCQGGNLLLFHSQVSHYVVITGRCRSDCWCVKSGTAMVQMLWKYERPSFSRWIHQIGIEAFWGDLEILAVLIHSFLSSRQREQHFRHEQWGQSVGEIEIENHGKTELSLKGVRSHSYGNSTGKNSLPWEYLHCSWHWQGSETKDYLLK